MVRIVFLNVGQDTYQAELLCRSARISNRGAMLTQVTDGSSPKVMEADEVVRFEGEAEDILFFRMLCFSRLKIEQPTYFVDTDMLLMKALPEHDGAGFCVREFQKSAVFNHRFRGMDLTEYKGMTLGEVYPIIACTTFSSGPEVWSEALTIYGQLPSKFRTWFGDQEALKRYADLNPGHIALHESEYACLPEFYPQYRETARIAHFKGASRKPLLPRVAKELGIA